MLFPFSIFSARFRFALIFGVCATAGATAQAQTTPTLPQVAPESGNLPPQPRAVVAFYKLGPDDVLSVTVENAPQYSQDSVIVTPDGKISLPVYGTLHVAGLTVAQVQTKLRAILTDPKTGRMRNPNLLSVSLIKSRPIPTYSVYVLNNGVRSPGVVQILLNYRLTEVIAKAGGLNGNAIDLSATLTRGQSKPIALNLQGAITSPESAANVRIQPGDVLTVTQIDYGRINLDGDIARPGPYLLKRLPAPGAPELSLQPRLLEAIVAAGGLTPVPKDTLGTTTTDATAIPTRYNGVVVRGPEKNRQIIPLKISEATEYTDLEANVLLQAGDYVRIDAVPPVRVFINGLVHQTGALTLAPDSTVVDAIAQAGGLSQVPEKVVVTISRAGKILPVDLIKAVLNDPTANLKLQSRDVVQVTDLPFIQVAFSGEVTRPDTLKLPLQTTLSDAVAQAGGLKIAPQDAKISLLRTLEGGKPLILSIDPVALFANNDLSQNVRLQDNDAVTISEIRRNTVFVNGEVNSTGPQTIREGEGVVEVLTRAGGPTKSAALTRVVVQRGTTSSTVDVYDAFKTGQPINFPLQEGDVVVVPARDKKVAVLNAVANPDFYLMPEKAPLTVLEAITEAGSALPSANTKQIVVMRAAANGEIESHVFSLVDFAKGNWSGNTQLRPDDVVYVPHGKVGGGALASIKKIGGGVLLLNRVSKIP